MTDTTITKVDGRRVWDSRGRPTLEVDVTLASGAVGRAIAPAGASRGSREAIDLRDGGARFGGMDVTQAIANVDGADRSVRSSAAMRFDQAGADAALDRARRHTEQGEARRQRHGRGVARGRARRGGAAGMPLWRHLAGDRRRVAAAARDPDLRRRRARRTAHRPPGPDGDAGRRDVVRARARR